MTKKLQTIDSKVTNFMKKHYSKEYGYRNILSQCHKIPRSLHDGGYEEWPEFVIDIAREDYNTLHKLVDSGKCRMRRVKKKHLFTWTE